MLSKTRTTIIALVASVSFAGPAIVPTVAQARPKLKVTAVTCPDTTGQGVGQPGEIRTTEQNIILPNGTWGVEKEKKICGSDGKWHKVVDRVQPGGTQPEAPTSLGEPASQPARLTPPTPVGTLLR